MEVPTNLEKCLAILLLRRAGCSQDEVAELLHCGKLLVGHVEKWYSYELPYQKASELFDDLAIKTVVDVDLTGLVDDPSLLVKIARIKPDDILRCFRKDYVQWKQPVKQVEKRIDPVIAELRKDHYARLCRLAEGLELCLQFPSQHVVRMVESRFGGYVSGQWFYDGSEVSFSAEMSPLWHCLLKHLDFVFTEPKFSEELKDFKRVAANLVKDNMAAPTQKAQSLRNKLWLVIERGTFKGECDICKEW